jgi:hypothetical protein
MPHQQKYKITDYQLINSLKSIFRIPPNSNVAGEYLEYLGDNYMGSLPFNLAELRVMYPKIQVVNEVLFTKKSSVLLDWLDDTPDSTLLVCDGLLKARDALYVVKFGNQDDLVSWFSNMESKINIMVGSYGEEVIVAAPLAAFV